MVSHYVVSWIQVIGLIVGLFGLFYLSLGLLGKTGGLRLRSLLPASAAALTLALLVRPLLSLFSHFLSPHLSPPWANLLGSPVLAPVLTSLVAVGGFLDTYQSTFLRLRALSQVHEDAHDEDRLRLRDFPLQLRVVAVVVGVLALVSWGALTFVPGLPSTVTVVISVLLILALYGLAMAAIITTEELVLVLSEQRLQTIGFFASVLAVSTQFLPPLLDILNIKTGK